MSQQRMHLFWREVLHVENRDSQGLVTDVLNPSTGLIVSHLRGMKSEVPYVSVVGASFKEGEVLYLGF